MSIAPEARMYKRGSGNPLLWPIVEHNRYLVEALSYDSAYLIPDWPYGHVGRCLKRVWQEQALSHSQAKNWRLVGQTTRPKFNYTYTNEIEKVDWTDSEQVVKFNDRYHIEYEKIRLTAVAPFWNKPTESTYHLFCCWELVDCRPVLDAGKDQIQQAVRPLILDVNSTYADLILFLNRIVSSNLQGQLQGSQIGSLRRVEVIGRRYNAQYWPNAVKWETWGLPYGS